MAGARGAADTGGVTRLTRRHAAGDDALRAAVAAVGSTLDVARTADELVRAAVPALAELAVVDLFDGVTDGEEPPPGPVDGWAVTLRRAAVCPSGQPRGGAAVGAEVGYHPGSPYERCLDGGGPQLVAEAAEGAAWLPAEARAVAAHGVVVVPLAAHGAVLGLLHLYRGREYARFHRDDLDVAAGLGRYGGACLDNARRATHETRSLEALRHALLRDVVPAHPSVEHARRYLPGRLDRGAGGSWCDVIALSSARVALIAGDATGRGMQAVARAGRARSAIRALLSMDLAPGELLTHLDHVVRRLVATNKAAGETNGVTTTCLVAFYDPVSGRCQAASAGHPPPVLVRPGRRPEALDMPVGRPFGEHGVPFETVTWDIPDGGVLAFHAGGPARGHGGGPPAALLRALEEPADSLEEMAGNAADALREGRPADEDAVLLLARPRPVPAPDVVSWELPPEPAAVSRARDLAAGQLTAWGAEDEAATMRLIVSELLTNAIRYGRPPLTLRLIRGDRLVCEVADASSTSPHLRHAAGTDEGGRGLFLVAQLADTWGTRYTPQGKTIWAEQPLDG